MEPDELGGVAARARGRGAYDGAGPGDRRLRGEGGVRAGPRDAQPVRRRAGKVDQLPVGGDVGLEPVVERADPARLLRPGQVVRAVDADVVAEEHERPQVAAGEPERVQVRANVVHRHALGRRGTRGGEEPVETRDHARRSGPRIELEHPLMPERAAELGACLRGSRLELRRRPDRHADVERRRHARRAGRRGDGRGRRRRRERRRREAEPHGEREQRTCDGAQAHGRAVLPLLVPRTVTGEDVAGGGLTRRGRSRSPWSLRRRR